MVLVMMVLKYDLEPMQGKWTLPPSRPHITTSIFTPLKDIPIRISPREDSQDSWSFVWKKPGFVGYQE